MISLDDYTDAAEDADSLSDEVAYQDEVVVMAEVDSAEFDGEDGEDAELLLEEVAELDEPEAVEESAHAADASGFRRIVDQSQDV